MLPYPFHGRTVFVPLFSNSASRFLIGRYANEWRITTFPEWPLR
jgi:hypothetical protein